jgi:hypothetical protein
MVLWEGVLGAVFGMEALADDAGSLAWRGRVVLSLGGLALFLIGWLCPGIGRRVSLLLVSCAFPVLGFEAFAGPFVGRDTTIFARDAELGWCLRPGARDSWLGAVVEINVDGMRGPELRTDASQRILFLGDSVVFGAFIERDAETLSAMTESALAAEAVRAQCLNAGVGGWSPWQERIWYEREGAALGAGVVLVHLVLNDVTEPLVLERHGGEEEGFQLDRSREPGWWRGTSWATALRRWRRSARGDEERASAEEAAALGVFQFLRTPALPESRAAFALHLREVESLVDAIGAAGAVPVVVSHPYTVQFEVPGLWWPQDAVAAWCAERGIPHLDLGRFMVGARDEPEAAYHDGVHPNADGAALMGREIAEFLLREGLVN